MLYNTLWYLPINAHAFLVKKCASHFCSPHGSFEIRPCDRAIFVYLDDMLIMPEFFYQHLVLATHSPLQNCSWWGQGRRFWEDNVSNLYATRRIVCADSIVEQEVYHGFLRNRLLFDQSVADRSDILFWCRKIQAFTTLKQNLTCVPILCPSL